VIGPDTADICYATQHRQTAVRDLCKVAELILVVGARNSSNSNRLREIGVEEGLPQLSPSPTPAISIRPGSTASKTSALPPGASAPEALVVGVIEALCKLTDVEVLQMDGVEENIEFRLPAALREPVTEPTV